MTRFEGVETLMDGMAAHILAEVDEAGVVLTRWGLVKPRKDDFLQRFQTTIGDEKVIRGVVIEPASPMGESEVIAIVPGDPPVARVRDNWRFRVFVFNGVQDTDEEYRNSMERVLAVADALQERMDYSGVGEGVILFSLPSVTVEAFGYGDVSSWGAWVGEISVRCQVDRGVAQV